MGEGLLTSQTNPAAPLATELGIISGLDATSDPVAARQAVVAKIGRESLETSDVMALALEAARLAATVCLADEYSFSQPDPEHRAIHLTIGPVVAGESSPPITELDVEDDQPPTLSAHVSRSGKSVVIADLSSDPRYADELLRTRSVVSAIICPVRQPRGIIGAVGIYSRSPRRFETADVLLLESVANLLAVSFARQIAESQLSLQTRQLAALRDAGPTPTFEIAEDARIRRCNPAMERLTGFSSNEVANRSLFSAFVLPEELENTRQAISKATQSGDCVQAECHLLTRDGSRRRVVWSFQRILNDDGTVDSLVGTGLDITERSEALKRIRRAELKAENAAQSLRAMSNEGSISMARSRRQSRNLVSLRRDRRNKERRSFPFKQCLAPILDGQMPTADNFCQVRCHDISAQGFSFYSLGIPDYRDLLVAFGRPGQLMHLTAEIVHVTPVARRDREWYLVGCRYTGRVGTPRDGAVG